MNESKQKKVGCLAGAGCLLVVFGFFSTGLLVAGGAARLKYTQGTDSSMLLSAAVGAILMFIGVILIAWAIVYGILAAKSGRSKQIFRYPNCFVVSRFAVNSAGIDVYDAYDGPDDDLKYYVQLKLPDGKNEEYRCAYEVFLCAGEGMRGEAVAQGSWLSQFVPYIGLGVASQPPGAI